MGFKRSQCVFVKKLMIYIVRCCLYSGSCYCVCFVMYQNFQLPTCELEASNEGGIWTHFRGSMLSLHVIVVIHVYKINAKCQTKHVMLSQYLYIQVRCVCPSQSLFGIFAYRSNVACSVKFVAKVAFSFTVWYCTIEFCCFLETHLVQKLNCNHSLRFPKYYNRDGEEFRKLYKAYGILFKIEVSGEVSSSHVILLCLGTQLQESYSKAVCVCVLYSCCNGSTILQASNRF